MQKINDLTGKRFGRLTVLYPTPNRYQGKVIWVCKCDCGTTKNIIGANLMNGSTVSCGCKSKQVLRESREKHGKSNTRIYNIYICMKERCYNPNSPSYKNYGGRGIEVCEEWANNFEAFYEWSIENGYQESLTIDRINNDDDYSPTNCRWVGRFTQANNTRKNRFIEYHGEIHTVSEWSRITGIPRGTINARLNRGLKAEDIMKRRMK